MNVDRRRALLEMSAIDFLTAHGAEQRLWGGIYNFFAHYIHGQPPKIKLIDLLQFSEEDLRSAKGLGRKSVIELTRHLRKVDLKLNSKSKLNERARWNGKFFGV